MNTRSFALAALTLASALSAGTANAYMGDGCGRDAQLHISRHTGLATCRPIFRETFVVVPAYPGYGRVAPLVVVPRFGGYGGYGGFPRHGGYGGFPGQDGQNDNNGNGNNGDNGQNGQNGNDGTR